MPDSTSVLHVQWGGCLCVSWILWDWSTHESTCSQFDLSRRNVCSTVSWHLQVSSQVWKEPSPASKPGIWALHWLQSTFCQMWLIKRVTCSRDYTVTMKCKRMAGRPMSPLPPIGVFLLLAVVIWLIGAIMLHLEELTKRCWSFWEGGNKCRHARHHADITALQWITAYLIHHLCIKTNQNLGIQIQDS